MLPEDPHGERGQNALRYGCFAVERLINELLEGGAERRWLAVKVFGGGALAVAQK